MITPEIFFFMLLGSMEATKNFFWRVNYCIICSLTSIDDDK